MKALERAGRAATSVWFRATPSNRPLVYEQSLPGTRRIPLRRGSEAATRPIGATDWPCDFQPRLWKFLNQADDRGRVIKHSIFEIENSVFNSLGLFLVGRAVIGSMLDVFLIHRVRYSMLDVFPVHPRTAHFLRSSSGIKANIEHSTSNVERSQNLGRIPEGFRG